MNCKPGDLAILITSANDEFTGMVVDVLRAGKPIRLAAPFQRLSGPVWWVRAPRPCMTAIHGMRAEFVLPDAALRPIRPGDLTDEEVRDLYAPKQTEAA